MASSYDRITEHVFQTPAWRALVAQAREDVSKPPMTAVVDYYCANDYVNGKDVRRGAHLFKATVRILGEVRTASASDAVHYEMTGHGLFHHGMFRKVFDDTFGKPYPGRKKLMVPTYNCKEDKAWDSFKGDAASRMCQDLGPELKALGAEIREQWLATTPEELAAGRERAFYAKAVKEIKEEVLKWVDKIPVHVLKEALDEVVVHAIMEA